MAAPFGKRTMPVAAHTQHVIVTEGVGNNHFAVIGLTLLVLCIATTIFAWFLVYEVPYERPFPGIFSKTRQLYGWAPWWIPTVAAGLFSLFLSWLLCRKPRHLSFGAKFAICFGAVIGALLVCRVVRNIGYVILFAPGGDTAKVFAVLPQMIAFNFSEALLDLFLETPVLIVAAALAALSLHILLPRTSLPRLQTQPIVSNTAVKRSLERRVSRTARVISSLVYGGTFFVAFLPSLPLFSPIIGIFFAVGFGILLACVWCICVLPEGEFSWNRLMFLGVGLRCVMWLVLSAIFAKLSPAPMQSGFVFILLLFLPIEVVRASLIVAVIGFFLHRRAKSTEALVVR